MNKDYQDGAFFFLIFLLVVFVLVIGPVLQIWSINTLFKTDIEYSYKSWCAVVILNGVLRVCTTDNKKK
jgi:hypothetical protein